MTGKELTKAVLDMAEFFQWRCIHNRPARTEHGWRTAVQGKHAKGWPDIFACRRERAVAIEIKGDGDRMRPEQIDWIQALADAGIETFVWRPADWQAGYVEEALR